MRYLTCKKCKTKFLTDRPRADARYCPICDKIVHPMIKRDADANAIQPCGYICFECPFPDCILAK